MEDIIINIDSLSINDIKEDVEPYHIDISVEKQTIQKINDIKLIYYQYINNKKKLKNDKEFRLKYTNREIEKNNNTNIPLLLRQYGKINSNNTDDVDYLESCNNLYNEYKKNIEEKNTFYVNELNYITTFVEDVITLQKCDKLENNKLYYKNGTYFIYTNNNNYIYINNLNNSNTEPNILYQVSIQP